MNTAFDPYQAWLGIPPAEQPAHHYRLLGLDLWENRWAVIDAAGDRQMAIVRSHESSGTAALAKQLHVELAGAKVCLLNPKQKAVYDEQLRQKLGTAGHACSCCCATSSRKTTGYVVAAISVAVLAAIVFCATHCCTGSGKQSQGSSASPDPSAPHTTVVAPNHAS